MDMAKAGLGVEVHTRPRGTHDWRETPASAVLDARTLKAAAQVCLRSRAQLSRPSTRHAALCQGSGSLLSALSSCHSCIWSIISLGDPLETVLVRVS